jgi:hypothetical protein
MPGNMKCRFRSARLLSLYMLLAGLLPAVADAVEFRVGVGLSDGRDNAALQSDYARLERDVRALRKLESQLERLAGQELPSQPGEDERAEWQRQSEWLLRQSEEVADLAGELDDYLRESRYGSTAAAFFDYQSAKFRSVQRLDAIKTEAKKYPLKGQAASERRDRAVKQIAATF